MVLETHLTFGPVGLLYIVLPSLIMVLLLLKSLKMNNKNQSKDANGNFYCIKWGIDNVYQVRVYIWYTVIFLFVAFAELQTDMTDLTTDLDSSRKPYHDYDEYTFRILFPGMFDHIILQPPQVHVQSIVFLFKRPHACVYCMHPFLKTVCELISLAYQICCICLQPQMVWGGFLILFFSKYPIPTSKTCIINIDWIGMTSKRR